MRCGLDQRLGLLRSHPPADRLTPELPIPPAASPLTPTGVTVARVVVDVTLKPEILDPQGRAVQGALGRLGLEGVTSVRQGKQFVIDIDGELNVVRRALLEELAASLLSNPVIEDYALTVEESA